MILHDIFPTIIAEYCLDRDFTEKEKQAFNSVNQMKFNMGNLTSINRNVLQIENLKPIKSFLLKCCDEYIKKIYSPAHKIIPYITQSWINYTETNQWHHKHRHENSFLSGVLYINADKNEDKIYFERSEFNQLSIHSNDWNRYNSTSWKYQ